MPRWKLVVEMLFWGFFTLYGGGWIIKGLQGEAFYTLPSWGWIVFGFLLAGVSANRFAERWGTL